MPRVPSAKEPADDNQRAVGTDLAHLISMPREEPTRIEAVSRFSLTGPPIDMLCFLFFWRRNDSDSWRRTRGGCVAEKGIVP